MTERLSRRSSAFAGKLRMTRSAKTPVLHSAKRRTLALPRLGGMARLATLLITSGRRHRDECSTKEDARPALLNLAQHALDYGSVARVVPIGVAHHVAVLRPLALRGAFEIATDREHASANAPIGLKEADAARVDAGRVDRQPPRRIDPSPAGAHDGKRAVSRERTASHGPPCGCASELWLPSCLEASCTVPGIASGPSRTERSRGFRWIGKLRRKGCLSGGGGCEAEEKGWEAEEMRGGESSEDEW
eukprot:scaffold191276_cov31-Tisochrysis_lutea.AAC.6